MQLEEFVIDLRVQVLEVRIGWNHASFYCEDGLDNACETTGSFQMAHIRFQRTPVWLK